MAKQTAFLQRLGDTFSFRIAIPSDLRAHFCHRELVRALRTTDKSCAVPLALSLASRAKRLFHDMRSAMSNGDHEKLMRRVQDRRLQSVLLQQDEEHESAINELKAQHKREVVYAKAEARSEGMAVAIRAGAATPSREVDQGHCFICRP